MLRFLCCAPESEPLDACTLLNNEEARVVFLKNVSADVAYRSQLSQLPSLQTDGTERKVMETLKALVKENAYSMQRLDTLCVGLNIWLYSVPTPKGSISINPDTHFQYHRVLRVYLGTETDWRTYRQYQLTDNKVSFTLEDTAFEEAE